MTKKTDVENVELLPEVLDTERGIFLDEKRFQFGLQSAEVLAGSTLLPALFHKNVANCMILLNMADRLQLDPFLVAQNLYIISGKPSIEAKLAIALINKSGKFTHLNYRMEGSGDQMKCTAYATNLSTGDICEETVSMDMAKKEGWTSKSGSKWKTLPELMLKYRSAMFFARVYCPESLMGLYTKDEMTDVVSVSGGVQQAGFTKEKAIPDTPGSETVAKMEKLTTEQFLEVQAAHERKPEMLALALKQAGIKKIKTPEEFAKAMFEFDMLETAEKEKG